MNVLYFHGFASSPQSAKLVALKSVLGSHVKVVSPDMNVPSFEKLDFNRMVETAAGLAERIRPDVVVGSSLGAVVALELNRRGVDAPLVLIAPAVGVGERWKSKLPAGDPIEVFNHAQKAQAKIHRAFFEGLADVRPEAEAPRSRVTIFMGRNDDTVPFDWVRGVWESWTESGALVAGSKFIEIAGGDHGLVAHVDLIAGEIEAMRSASMT